MKRSKRLSFLIASLLFTCITAMCLFLAFGNVAAAEQEWIYYGGAGTAENHNYAIKFEYAGHSAKIIATNVSQASDVEVKIPDTVRFSDVEYNVVAIGEDAFKGKANIIGISIPATVNTIEKGAFSGCSALASISTGLGDGSAEMADKLPDGLTEIADEVFFGCSSLTTISLPSSVKAIGTEAFAGSGLTSITLHEGIEHVGNYAFAGCSGITQVRFPDSVKVVNEGAFQKTGVSDLDLNKVEIIGASAFEGIPLKTLPSAVALKEIGDFAFKDAQLAVVRTGSALKHVGKEAFACSSGPLYFDIGFAKEEDCFWGENVFGERESVRIHKYEHLEGWGKCRGLSNTGEWVDDEEKATWRFTSDIVLDFTESLDKVIGGQKEVSGADGIRYKLYGTYSNGNVTEAYAEITGYSPVGINAANSNGIVIPDAVYYDNNKEFPVKAIVSGAFRQLSDIKITVGASVDSPKEIKADAFKNCTNLEIYIKDIVHTKIVDNESNELPLKDVWHDCYIIIDNTEGGIQDKNLIGDHIYVNHVLDSYNRDEQDVYYYVVDATDTTPGYAIVGAATNGEDTLSNTSAYAGSGFYSGANGHVIVPDYVTIGDTFYPVVGIGRYAFYNSNSLVTLELGAFVGAGIPNAPQDSDLDSGIILDCALRNCRFLESFLVDDRNPYYIADNADKDGGVTYGEMLFVGSFVEGINKVIPSKIVKAGINVTAFAPTGVRETVSVVEQYAFMNCVKLTDFDFTNIQFIGEHAFNNTSLAEVALPMSIEVKNYAFMNNNLLKKVAIGSENKLGRFVFRNCPSLQSFTSKSPKYVVSDEGALYELRTSVIDGRTVKYAVLLQFPAGRALSTEQQMIHVNELTFAGVIYPVRVIEAYAFAYSMISEVIVGENVNFVGKAAFENCVKLAKVHIGSGVVALGIEIEPDAPKAGQESLLYVDILEKNAGIFPRANYDIYEREAFDGCNVLAYVTVSKENAYYHADSNGILYNIDKTVLLMYAPGITRLTYTIPNTVTEIGLEAFEDNVHLMRLTIPEGVVKIGAKAFNGCTKLSFIYMRTLLAPTFGDQAFNSAGVLAEEAGLTVYCIPEPAVWYSANPEAWSNYNVEKYVAIQEIPNQADPTAELYLIYVIDSDGNYLPGMRVEYAYKGLAGGDVRKYTVVNEQGYALMTLPLDLGDLYDQNAVTLIVTDESGVYYEYNRQKNFYLDLETGYSYVTLRSIPGVNGVSVNGKDIDTGRVVINTAVYKDKDKEDRKIPIIVSADWDSSSVFKEFLLYVQEDDGIRVCGRFICDSESGEIVVSDGFSGSVKPVKNEHGIIVGGEFTFELDALNVPGRDSHPASYKYVASLTTELNKHGIGKDEVIVTEEDLRTDIFYYDFGEFENPFEGNIFSNDLSFSIKEDVPLLGGFNVKIDAKFEDPDHEQSKIFDIVYDKDKVYFTANFFEKETDFKGDKNRDPEDLYTQLSKKVDKMIEEMSGNSKMSTSQKLEFKLSGVMELQKSSLNGPVFASRTYVKGTVSYSFSLGKTFVVWVIPVRLELDISAEGSLALVMELDDIYSKAELGTTFEIGLKVEARAGVGCSVLSIGIYGNASIKLVFELFELYGKLDGTVGWDIGVYAKLNLGFFKYTQRFSLISAFGGKTEHKFTCTLYGDPEEASLSSVAWSIKRGDRVLTFQTLEEAVTYSLMTTPLDFTPVEEGAVYEEFASADAVVVEYNGVLYKFYIDNLYLNANANHKPEYVFDRYNYLKLVYSTYGVGGWSKPTVVNDGINNEIEFDVCVADDGIHIVYTAVNTVLDENNVGEYKKSLDVYVKNFHKAAEGPVKISTTDYYKTDLEIDCMNGSVYVAWRENSDYNLLGVSPNYGVNDQGQVLGDIETTANSVSYVNKTASGWTAVKTVEGLPLIADVEIMPGKLLVVLDSDCNPATANDRSVRFVDLTDGTWKELVFTAEADDGLVLDDDPNTAVVENCYIVGLNYENGVLYIMGDTVLYKAVFTSQTSAEVIRFATGVADDYVLIYDNLGELYGILYTETSGEESSDMYVQLYLSGKFSAPIQVISGVSDAFMIDYFTAYRYNGETVILYKTKTVTYTTVGGVEDIEKTTYAQESMMLSSKQDNLVLNGVQSSSAEIQVKKPFVVNVDVYNDSFKVLDSIKVELFVDDVRVAEKTFEALGILPGATKTLELPVTLEEEHMAQEYTVVITAEDVTYTDSQSADNSRNIQLVYPDVSVNAKYVVVGDIKYLLVMVQNNGNLPINGYTIYVANGILDATETQENALYEFTAQDVSREVGQYRLAPGAYKYYTIELNKLYFTDEYVTVSVVTDESSFAERNVENNVMSYSVEKNEAVQFGETYTLRYFVNNELVYSGTHSAGETLDLSVFDSYEILQGHTFSGWSGEREIMPSYDVDVYGYFIPNKYSVNYYVDGALLYTDSVEFGTDIPVRPLPQREGHTFNGWYTRSDLSGSAFEGAVIGDFSVNLYGEFKKNTYTIRYYVDSTAEPLYTQSYTYGDEIVKPSYTVPAGYSFSGWQMPGSITHMPAYDISLYATTQRQFYSLTYQVKTADGEYVTVRDINVQYDAIIPYYEYQAPLGYTFGGWYDAAENGNRISASDNVKMPASDMVLYGAITPKVFSVKYYVNDSAVYTQYVAYGAEIPAYVHSFGGQSIREWTNLPDKMPAADIVVYSVATANVYKISYYVEGVLAYTDSYSYGTTVKIRPNEVKEGYTFSGWTGYDFTNNAMPAADVRLDGRFEINTYKVKYYVDSKLWREDSYAYGASVTAATYTPEAGRLFNGFEGVPQTMPARDVYVYATTTLAQYKLSYYVDGKLVHFTMLPYQAEIPSYSFVPTDGYTVSAWSNLPATMPNNDVNVTATTAIASYDILYYVDGVLVKTQTYLYGSDVTAYSYTAPDGKIFLGFAGVPSTMPAKDVNVYGMTSNRQYHVNYYVNGELVYSDLYEFDAIITPRPSYERYGYTFSGWGELDRRMPAHDLDVQATSEKNSYRIYYYVDEELVYTDTVLFGADISAYTPAAKTGYTFVGWDSLPKVMPGEDITVSGGYAAEQHTVSYYINGEFYKNAVLAYGSSVDLSGFKSEKYEVTGWQMNGVAVGALTVGTQDIRLDATVVDTTPFVQTPLFVAIASVSGTSSLLSVGFFIFRSIRKKRMLGL